MCITAGACPPNLKPFRATDVRQAVDLAPCEWSMCFDHKEYLPDRVRAFCTRWAHRDLLNMRYYARVKRAGSCTAPPAHAQLMYEPQTYGLSPNAKLISRPAP